MLITSIQVITITPPNMKATRVSIMCQSITKMRDITKNQLSIAIRLFLIDITLTTQIPQKSQFSLILTLTLTLSSKNIDFIRLATLNAITRHRYITLIDITRPSTVNMRSTTTITTTVTANAIITAMQSVITETTIKKDVMRLSTISDVIVVMTTMLRENITVTTIMKAQDV